MYVGTREISIIKTVRFEERFTSNQYVNPWKYLFTSMYKGVEKFMNTKSADARLATKILQEGCLSPREKCIALYVLFSGHVLLKQSEIARVLKMGLSTTEAAMRRLCDMNVVIMIKPGVYTIGHEQNYRLSRRAKVAIATNEITTTQP
jgi:DNA-binding CsgD family transcriptional regulator